LELGSAVRAAISRWREKIRFFLPSEKQRYAREIENKHEAHKSNKKYTRNTAEPVANDMHGTNSSKETKCYRTLLKLTSLCVPNTTNYFSEIRFLPPLHHIDLFWHSFHQEKKKGWYKQWFVPSPSR
jgi:hypothetical protein